jgi:hypothetical protein
VLFPAHTGKALLKQAVFQQYGGAGMTRPAVVFQTSPLWSFAKEKTPG